ncbi:MAG: AtpZ/AtpI family protein [Devosia sp.]|uniref:AtpZ/AtpI family protein n=1 Tax=Devosia sp. TaxID=1871048 RepID=UPI001A0DA598|nr:AtpZ/AtpI family protein [Devosia sp.]MBF0681061.1 AtpZ/AtpI family protein [Devosia sp.]
MPKPPENQGPAESANEATRDLASRIASAKRERMLADNRSAGGNSGTSEGMNRGIRIGSEFVAAVLVGAVIGHLIDLGLGTSPWAMLIMLMMGFAAGILNVTRVVAEMNAATAVPLEPKDGSDKDAGSGQ